MKPEERKQEVIVGIVVLAIIVATILGIMWGNKFDLFSSRGYYTVRVARASGLEEGDPVTVSGVPKGVVDDFIVQEDSVDIIIGIDKDIILYNDASAIISNQELIGGKKVEVNPGVSGIRLKEHGLFRGTFAGGLEDLFETVGSITTDFQTLVRTFNSTLLLVNKALEVDVQASLHSIHSTARLIDSLMTSDIRPGIEAMKNTLEKTETLVDDKREDIGIIVANLKNASVALTRIIETNESGLQQTVKNLNKAGKELSDMSTRLKDPTTSLGKLTATDSLYQAMDEVLKNINSMVEDMKTDPEKYLKHVDVTIDMFGGGKKD